MVAFTGSQELVSNASQQRNWRGIVIALLVIIIVCALILTAVIIAMPDEDADNIGEKFTFDDYQSPFFKAKSFSATWLPGQNQFMYTNDANEIRIFNCSGNSSSLLVDNSTFRDLELESAILSPDGRYLLLMHNVEKVFRHSRFADYSTYDLQTRNLNLVALPARGDRLQYVAWASVGNALVLIQNNNVYYKKNVETDAVQLTTSGRKRVIYNGVPDWVYEEEVLGTHSAAWFSEGGSYLLYATFNDSHVPIYTYITYGEMDNPYTTPEKIAYPKPGYPNPTFTLTVVHLSTLRSVTLQPPQEITGMDYLFTNVAWRNDEEVLVTWMNRVQNRAIVALHNAQTGNYRKSLEIASTTGWLELFKPPVFTPDGTHYFWVLPQKEGKHGSFKHVAMVEIRNGSLNDRKTFLTQGRWEVTRIEGFDPVTNTVYFTSPHKDPRQMHLYSVTTDRREMVCETCYYNEKNCLYNKVSMSKTTDYYILKCLGPGIPKYALMSMDGTEVERLENNTDFAARVASRAMPQVVYEQVTLENGQKLWAKLHLPPELDMEEIFEYPLIVHVYGGPGSQMVDMSYSVEWLTYLCSSRDIIYATVDGRGTKGRGDKFMHSIYRQLGTHEVDDTIQAAKHFSELHYVDKNKMAVWGWSYGGYVTASILGRKTNVFKCGISVAPVTDWLYYDSIYTERFMGLPIRDDNLQAYRDSNVSKYAENFKTSSFMLIHGTGDDNVHFQQSAQLVKALTEADVYFRFQLYTDKAHGLAGGNTRTHLYESMEDFLVECYDGYSEKFGQPPDGGDSFS